MKTMQIPLSPNVSLDGGPFFAFEADPEKSGGGVLVGTDDEGNESEYTVDDVQEHIREEMERSEPVSVNSDPTDDPVGFIRVPLWPGFTVQVWDSKTPERDLDDLSDYSRRSLYEKRIRRHGGGIRG